MKANDYFITARAKHVALLQGKIDRLLDFDMSDFERWEIPFQSILNNEPWQQDGFYRRLIEQRTRPAVYYFQASQLCEEKLFTAFTMAKKESLFERIHGKSQKQTYNISHVPRKYKQTQCVYAGSVSGGLHGRLISHLGLGNTGTGGLFLIPVMKSLDEKPTIHFHYKILDHSYLPIIEHIERIIQDYQNPLIGKKALSRMDREIQTLKNVQ